MAVRKESDVGNGPRNEKGGWDQESKSLRPFLPNNEGGAVQHALGVRGGGDLKRTISHTKRG